MAAIKDTPNLPSSSRMQMPSTGGSGTTGLIKETGGLKNGGSNKGTSKKILSAASGTGLKKSNPYGKIC